MRALILICAAVLLMIVTTGALSSSSSLDKQYVEMNESFIKEEITIPELKKREI